MKLGEQRGDTGFTLIELVVVIVIIGILAAAALPRFVDLTGEAKKSAAQGVAGSLSGAAAMAHGKWLAQGSSGNITVEGSTVGMSSSGFPVRSSGSNDDIQDLLQQDPSNSGNWQWTAGGTSGVLLTTNDASWCVTYSEFTGTAEATSSGC